MKHFFIYITFLLLTPCIIFAQDDYNDIPDSFDFESSSDLLLKAKYSSNDADKLKHLSRAYKLVSRENAPEKTLKVLTEINNSWQIKRDATVSLRYALEELYFVEKNKNDTRSFNLLNLLANIYKGEKSYAKAIEMYKKAENYIEILENDLAKADFATKIGDTELLAKQFNDALPYYFEALKIYEKSDKNYKQQSEVLQKIIETDLQKKDYSSLYGAANRLKEKAKNKNNTDEAIATANMGVAKHEQRDFEMSAKLFNEAIALCDLKNPPFDLAHIYSNLGVAQQNNGNFSKSVSAFENAIKYAIQKNSKSELGTIQHLLGTIYFQKKDYFNAQQYNNEALKMAKTSKNATLLSKTYELSAQIYQALYDYENAFSAYREYLEINDSLLLFSKSRQQDLERQIVILEKTEKELQLSFINQDIQALTIRQLQLDKEKQRLEGDKKDNALLLLSREQDIIAANLKNKALEAEKAQQDLDLTSQRLLQSEKDKSLAILEQKEQISKFKLFEQQAELAKKETEEKENLRSIQLLTKDKDLLTQEKKISELEINNQKAFRRTAYGLATLFTVILGLTGFGFFWIRRNNVILGQKNKEIELERQKSEALLLNILPEKTAHELKTTGEAIPRHYKKVSILFADFRNFTTVAAVMSPQQLIEELNDCFINFDEIIARHGLEKIKTIGDAYMCAGGVPEPNETNPKDAVAAALELVAFMEKRNNIKRATGDLYWEMRVGINTGEVIAGVVGKQKFAYDIWGDAVNLASRLETASEPGKVNISSNTYEFVKNDFECLHRGAISVKNKGKVEMYFVNKKV